MINRFGPKACGICHRDIARGEEMQVAPGMSGPRGGKVYCHAHCTPARANPPKGRAVAFFDEHPGGSIAGMTPAQKKTLGRQERKQYRRAGRRQIERELLPEAAPRKTIYRKRQPGEGALDGVVIYSDEGSSPTYYARFVGVFAHPEDAQALASSFPQREGEQVWVEKLDTFDAPVLGREVYGVRVGARELSNYYGKPLGFAISFEPAGLRQTEKHLRRARQGG